mgnify:CR=1 FL=1
MGNRPDGVVQLVENRNAVRKVFLSRQGDQLRDIHAFHASGHVGQYGNHRFAGLVDDVADVRIALTRLVSSAGFEVETFESGAAFLQSLDDHEPDCVLLDLHMPGTNGFDVQRAMEPAHASVPVIVITGHDGSESRSRALSGGAKGYLCKPVDGERLLETIDAAITTRWAQAGWRRP